MPPIRGTSAGMGNRDNQNFIAQDLVRDDVGKSLNKCSPNAEFGAHTLVHWKSLGILRNFRHALGDARVQIEPSTLLPCLIVDHGTA
jgi:hypothetical protein